MEKHNTAWNKLMVEVPFQVNEKNHRQAKPIKAGYSAVIVAQITKRKLKAIARKE